MWTVISDDGLKVDCRCECGARKAVNRYNLLNGKSQSCGCQQMEAMRSSITTHGLSKTRAYRSWKAMKTRCYRETHSDYPRYGGRGIQVCDRWKNDFAAFFADMGERPVGSSLDRKDVDGDYCPENCHWTTQRTQMRNTRRTTKVSIGGRTMSIAEWSEESGISPDVLYKRLHAGWSGEALLSPVRKMRRPSTDR